MNNRVLVLSNTIAGLYSFRKEVLKSIVDSGYEMIISIPDSDNSMTEYFKEIGCKITNTSFNRRGTNPLSDFKLMLVYRKLIKKYNPKVILTYTIKPNVYGGIAARWCHVPQLANITGLGTAIENPGLLQKLTVAMYRFGLKNAQKVFYQNSSIQDFCQKNHIGGKGQLLPGSGVNLDWHTFKNYPSKSNIMKFNFIGRVMKDKGINEFFTMANYIRKKYPNTEFHIIGNCEEHYENMIKNMQDRGIVRWHGSVIDVRPYIEDSFATIHPSYHEGMANVILETCAAGRPVIASNINGCKEAIDDGINGYLCKVKDNEDLIKKVECFINMSYDEKKKMGLAARKKVENEFDRKIIIDAYKSEIKRV